MAEQESIGAAIERGRRKLARRSESARLDAELLLSHAMGKTRTWLHTYLDKGLPLEALPLYEQALQRYLLGEALPYILGWWEFYGRRYKLDPQVLIPRPETELLVETALRALQRPPGGSRVVDVGTGSGCVAVTLALKAPGSLIWASDISYGALQIARANARRHRVERAVKFLVSDLLSAFHGPFDVICANLPYVARTDLTTLTANNREPAIALDGGSSGIEVIRRLVAQLPSQLDHDGIALLEIGHGQGASVIETVERYLPEARSSLVRDFAGHERLVVITRGAGAV